MTYIHEETPVYPTPEPDPLQMLRDRVAELEGQLASSRDAFRRLSNEFDSFKQQVVEVAVDVQKEQGWCRAGLVRTLDRLGLTAPANHFDVTVSASFTVRGVEADSAEEAVDTVSENLYDGVRYYGSGEVDDWDTSIDRVDEADEY